MTKSEFKARHQAVRSEARRRANASRSSTPVFVSSWLRVEGKGLMAIDTTRQRIPSGLKIEPIRIGYPTIVDRPIRQRIAADLAWAAVYRRDALVAHRQRNAQLKALYVRAALDCVRDARSLMTNFARLPG